MTRQDLYELVWKMPVVHAARSVGLSDKGLANKCKALDVPMPPRGYWARVSAGAEIPRPPLPDSSEAEALSPKILAGLKLGGVAVEPPPARRSDRKPVPEGHDVGTGRIASAACPCTCSMAPRGSSREKHGSHADAGDEIILDSVRVAAAELQRVEAIHGVLQAVVARTVHAAPDQAHHLLRWVSRVRTLLDLRDPVDDLWRFASANAAP